MYIVVKTKKIVFLMYLAQLDLLSYICNIKSPAHWDYKVTIRAIFSLAALLECIEENSF